MSPLRALATRSALVSLALVLGLGLSGGLVRLLPWLLAPSIGLGPALPFARALLSAAIEAAVLLGAPVGVAVGAALFVERGEYRALAALGARPRRLLWALALPLASLLLLSVLATTLSDPAAPGRFARELIGTARGSCDGTRDAQRDVPMLGVTWVCLTPAPRLVGRVPGVAGAWFSAAAVGVTDDLRRASLQDLGVAGRAAKVDFTVRVREARLVGLPGWGTGKHLVGILRGVVIGAAAAVLAWFGAFRVVTRQMGALPSAAAALCASAASFESLRALDARRGFGWLYLAVPFLGVLAFHGAEWALSEVGRRAERRRIARATRE